MSQQTRPLITRRVTLNSSDSPDSGNTLTDLNFNLPNPMSEVVYADWTLTVNIEQSCFLVIPQLQNNGITSKGMPYFAALVGGSTQNLLVNVLPINPEEPRPVSKLTLQLRDLDGRPATDQGNPWSVEIVFYTRN